MLSADVRARECNDAASQSDRMCPRHRLCDSDGELWAQRHGRSPAPRGSAGRAIAARAIPVRRLYDEAAGVPALPRSQARRASLLGRLVG
jgi:hypothetical protein